MHCLYNYCVYFLKTKPACSVIYLLEGVTFDLDIFEKFI